MLEGWLLYEKEDYQRNRAFADRFLEGSGRHGLTISLRFPEDICFSLDGPGLSVSGGTPRFAVNRTRDWLLACRLGQAGCRVFNSSEVSRVCNDKTESHLLAARLGLPQVGMAFCPNTPDGIARHGLGYPVVVKDPAGHGGGEVRLARDEGELLSAVASLRCGQVLIQRLCGRPGEDVRVYALGGRILAVVKRRSAGDFRANLSLGGSVEPYRLSDGEAAMVERILTELKPEFIGIDFISDERGGLLFNELEDPVGSRSLYLLGLCDPAEAYMEHIRGVMSRDGQDKTSVWVYNG